MYLHISRKESDDWPNMPKQLMDTNNNNDKTNIYTGYTLQQVKTAVINVCPVLLP